MPAYPLRRLAANDGLTAKLPIKATEEVVMRLWHVNTTQRGGGVAEIVTALQRNGGGVIRHERFITSGDPTVFSITKRLHHRLHGVAGGELPNPREHSIYLRFAAENAERLLRNAHPSDQIVLHDPQTAPMALILVAQGRKVAWRCHIGTAISNSVSRTTWDYLSQFWPDGLLLIFSALSLVPPHAADRRVVIIAPSIDPTSPKNAHMSDADVGRTLSGAGLTDAGATAAWHGSRPRVESDGPIDADPVVVQISRWDPLKDMIGVLTAFADSELANAAHLVLCGPSPEGITDDPEAASVLDAVLRFRDDLPRRVRRRVHVVCPFLDDELANARLVNALQRRASVVTQKSLQEGFGLTVTEAMWKARPVVASRVGGIPSQLTHRRTGLLLDDPNDLAGFTSLVASLLARPGFASFLGIAAAKRVAVQFTTAREAADHDRLSQLLEQGSRTNG